MRSSSRRIDRCTLYAIFDEHIRYLNILHASLRIDGGWRFDTADTVQDCPLVACTYMGVESLFTADNTRGDVQSSLDCARICLARIFVCGNKTAYRNLKDTS
jgi:hypothetical protein